MKVRIKYNTAKRRRELEIAVEESGQRYRATFVSLSDSIIATDTEGRVELMNPLAEELNGWMQEEAIGKACRFQELLIKKMPG
jgi:PAS domain S-box-containing protein